MQMLATNSAADFVAEIQEQMILDVVDFVRGHGLTLVEIFDTLGHEEAAGVALELIGHCSDPLPDAGSISELIGDVHVALQATSFLEMEELVDRGEAPFNIFNAVSWVGARVQDLDRRLI